jgi:hypothetical protein
LPLAHPEAQQQQQQQQLLQLFSNSY